MSHSPSKKVWLFALVALIILIGFFWYVGRKNSQVPTSTLVYQHPSYQTNNNDSKPDFEQFIKDRLDQAGSLAKLDTDTGDTKIYQAKDLKKIVYTNDPLAVKEYGLALAEVFAPLASERPNEARLTLNALETQDQKVVAQISAAKKTYTDTVNQLLAITVPEGAVAIHLQTINNLSGLTKLLATMEQILVEPVAALQAGQIYIGELKNFYQDLSGLNAIFSKYHVVFSENERINIYVNLEE